MSGCSWRSCVTDSALFPRGRGGRLPPNATKGYGLANRWSIGNDEPMGARHSAVGRPARPTVRRPAPVGATALRAASPRALPRRTTAPWLVCAASLVAACSPSIVRASGTATVPTGASIPTTTTTADPWAVPAVIDVAYLNRVLAELDHIDGDAYRDARAMNAVTPRYLELERSIRADDTEVALNTKILQAELGRNWANVRTPLGDRHTKVLKMISAPAPCIFATVTIDLDDYTVSPVKFPPWSIALLSASPTTDNPTHWVLAEDGFNPDGSTPSATSACARS